MRLKLSPEQQKIIEATDGAHLVLASAGSGKTRILTERIRYLIENQTANFKVLALTFTNKAAEEMKERLSDVPDISEKTFIGTIHAFCQTVIEAHGKAVGFPEMPAILDSETDRLEILREVMLENPVLTPYYQSKDEKQRRKLLFSLCDSISARKRELSEFCEIPEEYDSDEEELVFQDYNDRLMSQGVIDFDDILVLAYRILTEQPKIARLYTRLYKYICVDEAQDLNYAQYALMQTLAADIGNILMVGDPDQAIYGFNGSDRTFMLDYFAEDFDVAKHTLTQNYRSSKAVVRAGNALFPNKMDETRYALPGRCVVHGVSNEDAEAEWVVERIKELQELGRHEEIDGDINLTKMAVLARNRYVFQPLENRLDSAGILYRHRKAGTTAALESDVGIAFDFGIRLLINPRDRLHWRQLCDLWGVQAEPPGTAGSALENLSRLCDKTDKDRHPWCAHLLQTWETLAQETAIDQFPGLVEGIEKVLLDSAEPGDATRTPVTNVEVAVKDLRFLRDAWGRYARSVPPARRSLAHFRNQVSMGLATPQEKQAGLTLATVHSAKGLEFDIVFIMGMTEGTFPDYRAVRRGGRALEEEKNEAFVAMTRAKRWLYITYPKAKFMPWDDKMRVAQTPSRFVTSVIYQARNHENDQVMMVAEE